MFGPTQFTFLNSTHEFPGAIGWNDSAHEKLWLYNLHYFDDCVAVDAATRASWHADLITRWINDNPPPRGNGWEPYPTSLRIVNWIKWAQAGNDVPPGFHHSLAVQVRWLAKRLEHHLLANHLFVNAKALVTAGLYFDGAEAKCWREKGLAILSRELPVQVLLDGGHYERSPMYHALVLEDMLDLINAAQAWAGIIDEHIVSSWRDVAERMQGWLQSMSHADGQISFFNDAAFSIAPPAVALAQYATRLGNLVPPAATLPTDSGYIRAEVGAAVLIADVAPVGPDYQLGHAHADTLSFELSLDGQRVFVNSGTSTYQSGPQRQFERSTRAHNTVEIDGADSSEVWGGFRVARRARPRNVSVTRLDNGICIRGAHDGYARLPGKPMHEREWLLEEGRLRITDRITGIFTRAVARFHLHPMIAVQGDGGCVLPNGRECRWSVCGGAVENQGTHWHPEFGSSNANRCLNIVFSGNELVVDFVW
jgi:uncharacterized heparinase superfamily protein